MTNGYCVPGVPAGNDPCSSLSRGIARNLFLGGIKFLKLIVYHNMQYVLTSLLLHKKFTWPDFGRVYILPPRRYAPVTIAAPGIPYVKRRPVIRDVEAFVGRTVKQ